MKNGQSLFLKFIMKLWPCCINHEPYPSYFHSHLQNTFAIVSLNSFNVTSDLFDQILKYRNDGRKRKLAALLAQTSLETQLLSDIWVHRSCGTISGDSPTQHIQSF
ncbi:hypothetical protein MTR_7g015060 [Medicago truncatula]|uniref:Uncharacterized protein n=1 Tax=Medicago truncatula TaxID=3880 RepID=A0A072TW47_MEDTR|nr:hypothetical protein MTR_7g015060 [Medicago truncatula]